MEEKFGDCIQNVIFVPAKFGGEMAWLVTFPP